VNIHKQSREGILDNIGGVTGERGERGKESC